MHEIIKEHSVTAGYVVKQEARDNDLLERLAADDRIPLNRSELDRLTGDYAQFTGRAARQTEEYLQEHVYPLLAQNKDTLVMIDADLSV